MVGMVATPVADESRVVRTLLREGRRHMLRHFVVDSCIAAARITVEVLSRFGIASEAIPVRVRAITHPLAGRIATGSFQKPYRSGEYGIMIGADLGNPEKFPGHLVVVTARRLIDLSLDQGSRPKVGLILEPSSFLLRPGWPQIFRTRHAVIAYERIADQSWRSAPDWNRDNSQDTIDYVCQKV